MSASTFPSLSQGFWPAESYSRVGLWLRATILVVVGSLALWASAKIQVPFYPVPMTMQTFVLLMMGVVLGWRLGVASVLLYLFEGAVGLPVFAGTPARGIGFEYMMGPTGGYLIGFVLATACVGYAVNHGWVRNTISAFLVMLWGSCVLYICGLIWLRMVLPSDVSVLAVGLYPFLWGDLLKIGLATVLIPMMQRSFRRRAS